MELTLIIEYDDEGDEFLVTTQDCEVPALYGQGATGLEAIADFASVLEEYIEIAGIEEGSYLHVHINEMLDYLRGR